VLTIAGCLQTPTPKPSTRKGECCGVGCTVYCALKHSQQNKGINKEHPWNIIADSQLQSWTLVIGDDGDLMAI
jgi:hypothetical protein